MWMRKLLSVTVTVAILFNVFDVGRPFSVFGEETEQRVSVIVELAGNTTLETYTDPKVKTRLKASKVVDLDTFLETDEAIECTEDIVSEQQSVQHKMQQIDPQAKFSYSYTNIINGFAATISLDKMQQIADIKGVSGVYIDQLNQLDDTVASGAVNTWGYTYSGGEMVSSRGYTGKNRIVAVIDTGVNYNHITLRSNDNYTASEQQAIKTDFYNKVGEKAGRLSAKNLSASRGYINAKVPFGYDYSGKDRMDSSAKVVGDDDPMDDPERNGHGTHVAGIVAATTNATMKSIAPDAMLLAMKIFPNAYDSIILAAIDDAISLGADVINISAGSPAGFSDDDGPSLNYIQKFEVARRAGLNVAVSAGNSGQVGLYGGGMYTGAIDASKLSFPYATNPDTAEVGAPSARFGTVSVASYGRLVDKSIQTGRMSISTAIGPVPDLTLKPDISAPGENILSASYSAPNQYVQKSGTSMSTPMVAGGLALIKQYIDSTAIFASVETKAELAEQILTSTAHVIVDENGVIASPRKQGAGAMDLDKATKTMAVVYNNYNGRTKIELGDKLKQSTQFTFNIKNYSNQRITYHLASNVLTDKLADADAVSTQIKIRFQHVPKVILPDSTPLAGATLSFDQGDVVTVSAGGSVTVRCTLTIPDLTADVPNGRFVEGFISLVQQGDKGDAVDLSIPFLGFQGDWLQGAFVDAGNLYAPLTAETDMADIPFYAEQNRAVYPKGQPTSWVTLGAAGYADSVAISPRTADGECDESTLQLMLLRNVQQLYILVKDSSGDTVRTIKNAAGIHTKKAYPPAKDTAASLSTITASTWNGKNDGGVIVPEGKYIIEIHGISGYDANKNGVKDDPYAQVWKFPICVDDTAPVLSRVETVEEEDGLYARVLASDNQYVKDIISPLCEEDTMLSPKTGIVAEQFKLPEEEEDKQAMAFYVVDYAGNQSKIYHPYHTIQSMQMKDKDENELPTELRLPVGSTYALRAICADPGAVGELAADLTWTTSNDRVATVDPFGVVTATGAGDVRVQAATPDGVTASCDMTVLREDGGTATTPEMQIVNPIRTANGIRFDVTNNTKLAKTAQLYITIFAKGTLVQAIQKPLTVDAFGTISCTEAVHTAGYEVKVMVWEQGHTLRPLSQPAVF